MTIVERAARLLPREDEDIDAILTETLREEGIAIVTGAEVEHGRAGGS